MKTLNCPFCNDKRIEGRQEMKKEYEEMKKEMLHYKSECMKLAIKVRELIKK